MNAILWRNNRPEKKRIKAELLKFKTTLNTAKLLFDFFQGFGSDSPPSLTFKFANSNYDAIALIQSNLLSLRIDDSLATSRLRLLSSVVVSG